MKNTFLSLFIIFIIGCDKDKSTSPNATSSVHSNTITTADTSTIFITAAYQNPYNPSLMYWLIEDSIKVPLDTNGHYYYVYQYKAIDSIPSIKYPSDSAVGYVLKNGTWNRMPINYYSWGLQFPDTLCSVLSDWYKDNRAFMIFEWQTKVWKYPTYINDTIHFKVFIKPSNSNIQP